MSTIRALAASELKINLTQTKLLACLSVADIGSTGTITRHKWVKLQMWDKLKASRAARFDQFRKVQKVLTEVEIYQYLFGSGKEK